LKYNDETYKKIKDAVRSAKASLAVEGIVLTEREELLIRMALEKTITQEEFMKQVEVLSKEGKDEQ
jgi:hypothetical protein